MYVWGAKGYILSNLSSPSKNLFLFFMKAGGAMAPAASYIAPPLPVELMGGSAI